jgi:hypothetical protein
VPQQSKFGRVGRQARATLVTRWPSDLFRLPVTLCCGRPDTSRRLEC